VWLFCQGGCIKNDNFKSLQIRIFEKSDPKSLDIRLLIPDAPWIAVRLTNGIMSVNEEIQQSLQIGNQGFEIRILGRTLRYSGSLSLRKATPGQGGSLMILNLVPFRDYVAFVTAAEANYRKTDHEYLLALSHVVAGYAAVPRARHKDYDFCDLAHCQVYRGFPPDSLFWTGIADILVKSPRPTLPREPVFHLCCGGELERPEDVWSRPGSETKAVRQDKWQGLSLCSKEDFFRWERQFSTIEFSMKLIEAGIMPAGANLTRIEVSDKTQGGSCRMIALEYSMESGAHHQIQVPAVQYLTSMGRSHGWGLFPSRRFTIRSNGNQISILGKGIGHGAGLCQTGARSLAAIGFTADEILDFYFPASW